MARTFFLNLLMSFVFVLIGMIGVVIVNLLIIAFLSWALGGWLYVSRPVYYWISFSVSLILSVVMAILWGRGRSGDITSVYGICATHGISQHWKKAKKPIKYHQVVWALTPSLFIAVGLIISMVVGYNTTIAHLENVNNIATSLEDFEGYFIDVSGYLSIFISAAILFTTYFFMMAGAYKEITCPYCKTVGRINYKLQNTETKTKYELQSSTSEEKLGELRSESGHSVEIHGNVTRSSLYEVTTTREYYLGTCEVCGGVQKRSELTDYKRTEV